MLPPNQLNNIIRFARRADASGVAQLRHVTFANLKRLGVNREPGQAIEKTPGGSDQVDVRSIVEWIEKITTDDKPSVEQLVVIDATLVARG